jgi:hypothetical protein
MFVVRAAVLVMLLLALMIVFAPTEFNTLGSQVGITNITVKPSTQNQPAVAVATPPSGTGAAPVTVVASNATTAAAVATKECMVNNYTKY